MGPAQPRRAHRGGFTLIELMVAMALFSAIAAGVISTVISISRAQQAAARVDVAQTGVRAVLDVMTHDVEMASAGGKAGTYWNANSTPTTVLAIQLTDSSTGPDRLDLVVTDPSASATLMTNFVSTSTALIVDSVTSFPSPSPVPPGYLIELTDLAQPSLLTAVAVTAAAGTPTLTVTVPSNPLPRTYLPGALVFRMKRVAYYVDSAYLGAEDPVLMYVDTFAGPNAPEPVAEGIEDLQIALGYDNNLDGNILEVGAAANDDEWMGNYPGETIPATLTNLHTVRVTLVARTVSTIGGTGGTRPKAENHAASATRDAHVRRVMRSEIMVRNLNL